jgi:hypothetical protein
VRSPLEILQTQRKKKIMNGFQKLMNPDDLLADLLERHHSRIICLTSHEPLCSKLEQTVSRSKSFVLRANVNKFVSGDTFFGKDILTSEPVINYFYL